MKPSIFSTSLELLGSFYRVSKVAIRNKFSALCVAGAFIVGSVVAAAAQTTPIPLVISTANGNGAEMTTLTGLPTTTSTDASLSLIVAGRLSLSGQTLTVRLDGVTVAVIGNIPACLWTSQVINVPQAVLAPLISDGQIVVSYHASSSVSNHCGSPASRRSFQAFGSVTYFPGAVADPEETPTAASASVARFLDFRARSLIQNQPDVVRFVDGRNSSRYNAEVTRGNGNVDLATGAISPLWASARGSWSDSNVGDQSYVLGSFGGHFNLGSNAVVGAMFQHDYSEREETGVADVEGSGWLIGPYFAAQIGDHPLYLDGRVLYGPTDNEVTPFGAAQDDFDGERWLAMLGLEGKVEADNVTIFPGIGIRYVRDDQDTYVDSTAALIQSQSIEQTEVALGLDFEIEAGAVVLMWGASGIWSETDGSGPSAAIVQFDDGWRGRIDLGFRHAGGAGLQAETNAFVDGLGNSDKTYGLSLTVSYTF